MELLSVPSISARPETNATAWVKDVFVVTRLGSPDLFEKPFHGLDEMLLLSWVREQFSTWADQPFVLQYWDLRMPNILVDEEYNIVGLPSLLIRL